MSLENLKRALVTMHQSGLRGGLPMAEAQTLVGALEQGVSLGELTDQIHIEPRLIVSATAEGVGDLPAVLTAQARVLSKQASRRRFLTAAGTYPLVLALSVMLASAVLTTVMEPALTSLVVTPSETLIDPMLIAILVAAALLLGLAGVVLGRYRVPGISEGWQAIDRAAFFESLTTLLLDGVDLPAAVRASAAWCSGRQRTAALTLARALEAGETTSGAPLLFPLEATLLQGAAQAGTAHLATQALSEQQQIRLTRRLPSAVFRIHLISILIAGAAVLGLGLSFFVIYFDVLAITG